MTPAFQFQTVLETESATLAFAIAMAPLLRPGDTLLLEGQIGAGKSLFSRAVIQARLAAEGRAEDVPSPTFTLVQVYELADTEIWHSDLYRLGGSDEVIDLGLEEAFETAICLVEWPDRLGDLTPDKALRLTLEVPQDAQEARKLHLNGPAFWADRLSSLLQESAYQ